MHTNERHIFGKANNNEIRTEQCHLLHMENELAYASQHMEKIGSNQSKLLDKLYELESRIH
ncbi:hypothetical protein [Paenibacillus sp.]|uniref:hypothetical protein n=1 Tax=Paenibacillus sp. TaxID=58172 RepID=UPI0028AC9FDA|nr:hypothetical protein [Paenibacillus sp.]